MGSVVLIVINTTGLTLDQLADAWRHVHDASAADEADPLVLDCARRLAADPGGEQAHVWVSGLVAMSGYLAWRPGQAAEGAALDALRAAAKALGDQPCAHDSHPYEAETGLLEDEIWRGDNGLLTGALAGPVLCPQNVAGWARLAVDVIAPFTVRRIPAGAPKYHHSRIRSLSGIVNDYPYVDPHEELIDEATCLPDRPTRGVLAGYLVTMNATCWYAASERITDRAVLDAMIKGVEAAVPLLGDGPCTHSPGEHPDTRDPDYTNQAGYLLRSPGGRAEIAEYYGWDEEDEDDQEDEPLDAWVCPAFLHDLADETLAALTAGLRSFEAAGAAAEG
ncbi:hypothetical protein FHS39_001008 [Streptomyces olivoverticillatus]|uniref:Uncharacterized protein n=1 Tax=Streptomyces olivoverticillatus TaxID=66427 RepID=A0A7W7PK41_9ACTN|nr:hypothetical protein [Streptomyces olivoverticillatus]MBB4892008.1 hypothetical protein [Streptomyces olivoverticillatus]